MTDLLTPTAEERTVHEASELLWVLHFIIWILT